MNNKYRAQILLEPEQHAALAEAAQRENRSLSDLMREIVDDWLARLDQEAQRQRELLALEELTALRLNIQEEHGIYTGNLIDDPRRDEDVERVWRGAA
jgi:hypothetical protein